MKDKPMSFPKNHGLLNLETLQNERNKTSFDIRQLTYVLDGGKAFTELYEVVCKQLERDPIFQDDGADLSIMEQRRLTMCRLRRIIEYKEKDDERTFEMRMHVIGLFGGHAVLFMNTLSQNATDEQLRQWWDDAYHIRTIGCFAMVRIDDFRKRRKRVDKGRGYMRLKRFPIIFFL
jgi:acyl-CoA oxidase